MDGYGFDEPRTRFIIVKKKKKEMEKEIKETKSSLLWWWLGGSTTRCGGDQEDSLWRERIKKKKQNPMNLGNVKDNGGNGDGPGNDKFIILPGSKRGM